MKKKLLNSMRVLLVAAGLAVGASASWAGTRVLYSQDYKGQAGNNASGWAGQQTSFVVSDGDEYVQVQRNATNSGGAYTLFGDKTAINYTGITNYTVQFDAGGAWLELALFDGNSKTNYSRSDYGFTNASTDNSTNNLAFFQRASQWVDATVTNSTLETKPTLKIENNVWYHYKFDIDVTNKTVSYTITSAGKDEQTGFYAFTGINGECKGIYIRSNKGTTTHLAYVDNIVISYESDEDVANAPVIVLTGVNNEERTYSISFTEGETLHYTLPGEEEEKTVSTGSSISVTATQSGTLSAYTTNGEATSETISETVVAEIINLNAPSIYVSDMNINGSFGTIVLNATSDQSDKTLKPTATLTATFNGEEVTLPYSVTSTGTLRVTASAAGYGSTYVDKVISTIVYEVANTSIDYSKVSSADIVEQLGNSWAISGGETPTKTRWAGWSTTGGMNVDLTANNSDAYYTASVSENTTVDFVRFANGATLLFGYGIGRNVNSGGVEAWVLNNNANNIAQFKVYNGYGNNNNTYYAYATGDSHYTIPGKTCLQQVVNYKPTPITVSPSVTDYATFSSSYPLDFERATGVKAYYASASDGSTVTMTKVTGAVKAGTALLLQKTTGDISIPTAASGTDLSASNLLKPGTGAAVKTEGNTHRYVLAGEGASTSFYELAASDDAVTIPEGKAYLEVVNAGARLNISFSDGETTGIANVEKTNAVAEGIYNLNGQRVAAPQKGLYIVNGKKVIKK